MSNLCHCAKVSQLLKWRRGILEGKSKYYPKNLTPLVAGMVQNDDIAKTILASHYQKRREEYNKEESTEFVK